MGEGRRAPHAQCPVPLRPAAAHDRMLRRRPDHCGVRYQGGEVQVVLHAAPVAASGRTQLLLV
eukprot:3424511-Heterocapsa_arctica.AAC.1